MFRDFLREYIQDLIECSSDEYELTERDKDKIADVVKQDEHLWEAIYCAIYDELERFRVQEDDPTDVVGFDKQTELEKRYE